MSYRMLALLMGMTLYLAGCASENYDPRPPLQDREEFKIQQVVYKYLLEQDFLRDRNYSAIFLSGSDAEVDALVQLFKGHQPPIKPTSNADVRPNQTPRDRETGKPAVILSATVSEPGANNAQAVGTYYGGSLFSGTYLFTLTKSDGRWSIEKALKR